MQVLRHPSDRLSLHPAELEGHCQTQSTIQAAGAVLEDLGFLRRTHHTSWMLAAASVSTVRPVAVVAQQLMASGTCAPLMAVGLVLMLLQELSQRQTPPRIVAVVVVGPFPTLLEPQKQAVLVDLAGAELCGLNKDGHGIRTDQGGPH